VTETPSADWFRAFIEAAPDIYFRYAFQPRRRFWYATLLKWSTVTGRTTLVPDPPTLAAFLTSFGGAVPITLAVFCCELRRGWPDFTQEARSLMIWPPFGLLN
jgi:hypothetical protein